MVHRILAGEAPGNLLELVHRYFGLNQQEWGKDVAAGEYPWLERRAPPPGNLKMLVPLYGFVAGDSMGVVVLVQDHDSVAELARVLAQACEVRVRPNAGFVLMRDGAKLEPDSTVAEAGLSALDRVDLVSESGE